MSPLNKKDVVHLFGSIADHTIVEILNTDAVINDLEEVAIRLDQEDDVLGELRKPLSAASARVYEILMQDDLYTENERDDHRE